MSSCQLMILMIFMSCINKYFTQKKNEGTKVKIIFLHTICRNSDMFRSILIIFRELIKINNPCIKNGCIIKCGEICPLIVCIYYKICCTNAEIFKEFGSSDVIDFTTVLECNKINIRKHKHNNNNNNNNGLYCVSVTVCPS
jgi:hypothetical protein